MALTIRTYSHFFKVEPDTDEVRRACTNFAMNLIQWTTFSKGNRVIREPYKVFAASNKDRTEYRFHITQLNEFINHLENSGIIKDTIQIVEDKYTIEQATDVDLKIKKGWYPMEHQVPILEYLTQPVTANHLVTLYTGGGKSYISMQNAVNLGKRVLYLLRPAFMDKWEQDIQSTLDISPDDIAIVRGGAALMHLLSYPTNNVPVPKIILMSNKTYLNWLKEYELYGKGLLDLGYDCLPEDLYKHLDIGIRYIDEVHLDFHLNFKADMYTNIPKAAAMSASLINGNPFLERMYNVAYPMMDRYKSPPPKKYIEAKAVFYKLKSDRRPIINWPGRKEYSHGAYEKWILKHEDVLYGYLEMLKTIIYNSYIADYRAGDRLLVFCYSIQMATVMTEYLKEQYSDKTVERYVEDDEYANVMEPDIRVSTVLSAGTGIDIKKLRVAILTTAISSEQSNIQALGRLRELKDDDRPPEFYYLNCESIPKHMEYHQKKQELFRERVKSLGSRYHETSL